jgi:MFS family permease
VTDTQWLIRLCIARLCFGFIFMAYSSALPLLMADWFMTGGQAGLIHAGWHAGYLVSLVTAGLLSQKFGAKATYLSMSWAAVLGALMFAVLARGFWSALLLYALAGLCSGGSYTPGLTLIAERFSPERRGTAMGWYLAASSIGYGLFLFVGGAVMAASGWRASFLLAGAGPMLGLVLAYHVLAHSTNQVPQSRPGGGWSSWRAVRHNKPAMAAIWSYAFHSWELLALWAWLPSYIAAVALARHGPGAAAAMGAALAGLTFLTNAAGSVLGGRLSDSLGRGRVMMALTCVSISCSLLFGWLFSAPLWLITVVAIVYNLSALGDSSVYSSALTDLVPAQDLGAAFAMRAVLGFGLGALSPVILGFVLDFGVSVAGERATWAWGMAWSALGVGALPGLWAIAHMRRSARAGF